MKPKYEEKARLCYMNAGSFIIYIKSKYIYVYTVQDIETRFDTSNYKLEIPFITWRKIRRNNGRVCCIENNDIQLFNRWQWRKQKAKITRKYVIKIELKRNRLGNEINCFKNNIELNSLKKLHKESMKGNGLILKSH